jgi:hypothetical protein
MNRIEPRRGGEASKRPSSNIQRISKHQGLQILFPAFGITPQVHDRHDQNLVRSYLVKQAKGKPGAYGNDESGLIGASTPSDEPQSSGSLPPLHSKIPHPIPLERIRKRPLPVEVPIPPWRQTSPSPAKPPLQVGKYRLRIPRLKVACVEGINPALGFRGPSRLAGLDFRFGKGVPQDVNHSDPVFGGEI